MWQRSNARTREYRTVAHSSRVFVLARFCCLAEPRTAAAAPPRQAAACMMPEASAGDEKLPPGWHSFRQPRAASARSIPRLIYEGPLGEVAVSKAEAWQVHSAAPPPRQPPPINSRSRAAVAARHPIVHGHVFSSSDVALRDMELELSQEVELDGA